MSCLGDKLLHLNLTLRIISWELYKGACQIRGDSRGKCQNCNVCCGLAMPHAALAVHVQMPKQQMQWERKRATEARLKIYEN